MFVCSYVSGKARFARFDSHGYLLCSMLLGMLQSGCCVHFRCYMSARPVLKAPTTQSESCVLRVSLAKSITLNGFKSKFISHVFESSAVDFTPFV